MEILYIFIPLSLFTFVTTIFLSENPVYGVLAFVVVILHCVVLLIMLDLEFLAYVLAIVYIGAIVVLFLFVIMMFYIYQFNSKRLVVRGLIEYYFAGWSMSVISYSLYIYDFHEYTDLVNILYSTNIMMNLARILFNELSLLTIVAATIMLVGTVGAIILTMRINKIESNYTIKNRHLITDTIKKIL